MEISNTITNVKQSPITSHPKIQTTSTPTITTTHKTLNPNTKEQCYCQHPQNKPHKLHNQNNHSNSKPKTQ